MRGSVVAVCAIAAASAIVVVIGCNALLGNDRPERAPVEGGIVYVDGGTTVVYAEAGPRACDVDGGEKECFGACVSKVAPDFGCGSAGCLACELPNAVSASCAGTDAGSQCQLTSCSRSRFKDCDGDRTNGCETDTSRPESCGDCGKRCGGDAGLCAPFQGSYDCTGACGTDEAECSPGQCVNLLGTPEHCGRCDAGCPAPPSGGYATCANKVCGYACNAGTHHPCSDVEGPLCWPNADFKHCGETCKDCTIGAPPLTNPQCADVGGGVFDCVYPCIADHEDCIPEMPGCECHGECFDAGSGNGKCFGTVVQTQGLQ